MEGYLPNDPNFSQSTVDGLLKAISSGDDTRKAKAESYLKEYLHPRAFEAAWHCFYKKTKDKKTVPQDDKNAMGEFLRAAIQLHEYWNIDNTPDDLENTLETLEQYEQRVGLTKADRAFAPDFGYLGAIPLSARVIRPQVPSLGVDTSIAEGAPDTGDIAVSVEPEPVVMAVSTVTGSITVEPLESDTVVEEPVLVEAEEVVPSQSALKAAEEAILSLKTEVTTGIAAMNSEEDDVFASEPVRKPQRIAPEPKPQDEVSTLPELASLDFNFAMRLNNALGRGQNTIVFRYQGKQYALHNRQLSCIPDEFLVNK
jgi:hypothetical protein